MASKSKYQRPALRQQSPNATISLSPSPASNNSKQQALETMTNLMAAYDIVPPANSANKATPPPPPPPPPSSILRQPKYTHAAPLHHQSPNSFLLDKISKDLERNRWSDPHKIDLQAPSHTSNLTKQSVMKSSVVERSPSSISPASLPLQLRAPIPAATNGKISFQSGFEIDVYAQDQLQEGQLPAPTTAPSSRGVSLAEAIREGYKSGQANSDDDSETDSVEEQQPKIHDLGDDGDNFYDEEINNQANVAKFGHSIWDDDDNDTISSSDGEEEDEEEEEEEEAKKFNNFGKTKLPPPTLPPSVPILILVLDALTSLVTPGSGFWFMNKLENLSSPNVASKTTSSNDTDLKHARLKGVFGLVDLHMNKLDTVIFSTFTKTDRAKIRECVMGLFGEFKFEGSVPKLEGGGWEVLVAVVAVFVCERVLVGGDAKRMSIEEWVVARGGGFGGASGTGGFDLSVFNSLLGTMGVYMAVSDEVAICGETKSRKETK
ncbi:hypothetical protein ScalyP_jg3566 [Parmales sp. scaly parma]|nr:hypothetical protein ScalyP_jg3566 [Parmales sp. scaly parma]